MKNSLKGLNRCLPFQEQLIMEQLEQSRVQVQCPSKTCKSLVIVRKIGLMIWISFSVLWAYEFIIISVHNKQYLGVIYLLNSLFSGTACCTGKWNFTQTGKKLVFLLNWICEIACFWNLGDILKAFSYRIL